MSSMEKILLIIIIICIFILFTKVDSNIPEHFILPKRTKDYFLYEGQSLMDISFNTLNQVDNNYITPSSNLNETTYPDNNYR